MPFFTVVYDCQMRAERVEAKDEAGAIELVMSGEVDSTEHEVVTSPEAYKDSE